MKTSKKTNNTRFGIIVPVLLAFGLSACGGGGGSDDPVDPAAADPVVTDPTPTASRSIGGGGVKGPLANAIVTVYAFAPTQPGFKAAVIATGSTNNAAEITGLTLPFPLNPPYILEFSSDAGTTDITTGLPPVIKTLRSVITQSLLDTGEQIYATPLTTMAVDIAIANSNSSTTAAQFVSALTTAANQVTSTVGFGMPGSIDIFATPPLIDSSTDTAAEQTDVAAYRSAVEALTAVVFAMKQQSSGDEDAVLSELSMDLADGQIDGNVGGNLSMIFSSTALDVLAQDPVTLPIPNSPTNQTVADVQAILIAEKATTGNTTSTTELDTGGSITTTMAAAESNPDLDNDGTPNASDAFPLNSAEVRDTDGDGIGDNEDPDDDNNGILDVDEGMPQVPTVSDTDGDSFDDDVDNCPLVFNPAQTNTDNLADGGDACDLDDDEDGSNDLIDAFPLNANENRDADKDGVGDNADLDDDNDTRSDIDEDSAGASIDHDNDGKPNREDRDSDNDGVFDSVDFEPYNNAVTFNLAPVTSNSILSTGEDIALDFVLNVSDDGVAPGPLTYSLSDPANGALSGTAPDLTYTPNPEFSGSDSLIFTVSDGDAEVSNTSFVIFTVTPVNDPPTANDDTDSTIEDISITTINVLSNDDDIEGDSLSVAAGNPTAANGSVTNNNDGTFSYTPNSNYSGDDSFDYVVIDGNGGSDIGTLTINVAPVNDAPIAADDSASTNEDTAVTTANVLDNDSDVDLDQLSVVAGNPIAANGSVVNLNNGSFTYTPNPDFNGTDSFNYSVTDGVGVDTASVTVTVAPANDDPVATTDNFAAGVLTPTVMDVLANDSDIDGDSLTITAVSQGSLGSTVTTDGNTVTFTDINNNAPNSETFSYDLFDGSTTVTAQVIVSINVNVPPVANPDSATTAEDSTVVIANVLANDSDGGDGPAALTVTAADELSVNGGTVVNNGDGSFNYTALPDFTGEDSFSYTVSDGASSTTGTVAITVTPLNDDPVAADDVFFTDEDSAITTPSVLNNDVDIDDDSLTVVGGNPTASNGSVINHNNGSFTYTPNANFNGADSFSYSISDGNGGFANGLVTINVNPVNDLPGISGSPQLTAVEGAPYSFTPTASDPDGQEFLFSIVNLPLWADFDVTSGKLSGEPALSDVGGDFSDIVISVTSGTDTADLPAFSITVNASTGIAAVWDAFNWDDGSTWQ